MSLFTSQLSPVYQFIMVGDDMHAHIVYVNYLPKSFCEMKRLCVESDVLNNYVTSCGSMVMMTIVISSLFMLIDNQKYHRTCERTDSIAAKHLRRVWDWCCCCGRRKTLMRVRDDADKRYTKTAWRCRVMRYNVDCSCCNCWIRRCRRVTYWLHVLGLTDSNTRISPLCIVSCVHRSMRRVY